MVAVLDIECASWTDYATGAFSVDGDVFVTRNEDELIERVLEHEGDIWAHYGGRYDWLWLLSRLSRRTGKRAEIEVDDDPDDSVKADISMSGSSATRIRIGKTVLRDSFRLIPMSLAKAAAISGEHKSEVGLRCECGKDCGGYCAIRLDMGESDYRILEEYLVQDCHALARTIDFLTEYCADHDIYLKGTVGASAWATARAWADLPAAEWSGNHYAMARQGYYGGRTEVARLAAPHVERYDMHSAYPAALSRVELPIGVSRLYTRDAGKRLAECEPGIYRVTITIPESNAPPLPLRTGERICYPYGTITGTWALPELIHAVDVGAKIERCWWGLIWDKTEAILAPTCEKLWSLREAVSKSNPALARWLKWLVNSLTGKLAQKPDHRRVVMDTTMVPRACPGGECNGACSETRCCNHLCSGRCGRWEAIDPLGRLWSRPTWRMDSCQHVQWAGYLTSDTRVELHKQILHAGDDWVYTDTDSVYAMRELNRRIGESLGEWGHEGSGENWRAIAPKVYSYYEGDKRVLKCKGLPMRMETPKQREIAEKRWEDYVSGRGAEIDGGVEGLLTAARRGHDLFTRARLCRASRRNQVWCGGRLIDGERTRPPSITELEMTE